MIFYAPDVSISVDIIVRSKVLLKTRCIKSFNFDNGSVKINELYQYQLNINLNFVLSSFKALNKNAGLISTFD